MTYRKLRAAIRRAHRAGLNYREIGEHFKLKSHSVIYKIAVEGYKPKNLEIRMKLGLVRRIKWNQLSKKDLLWALENRKEFTDGV